MAFWLHVTMVLLAILYITYPMTLCQFIQAPVSLSSQELICIRTVIACLPNVL